MNIQKEDIVYRLIALVALALIIGPVGISCIIEGYMAGNNPCVLCWQERIAIILVALTAMFILRYGLTYRYIGVWTFVSTYGLWAGYRHSSRHILRDIGQGFGPSILGIHTYVWIMIIFLCILVAGALFLIYCGEKGLEKPRPWDRFNKITSIVFLTVIGFNIVQAVTQVGPPPYLGQGDPYRMTFNPKHIVWSLDEWPKSFSSFSLGDFFHIKRPDFTLKNNVDKAEQDHTKKLEYMKEVSLPDEIQGVATGISYNAAKDVFAVVTTDNWVYLLDGKLEKVLSSIRIDGEFSVEISNLAGITFDGDDSVLLTTDHKSYVKLEFNSEAKFEDQYWKFIEGSDGIKEVDRGRFATQRSKNNYIGGIAWDGEAKEYLAVTIPNVKNNHFVLMRLDGEDFQLNRESKIKFTADGDSVPFVTGVAVNNGYAYLLDHASSRILLLNLADNSLEDAYFIENVSNPEGITVRETDVLVIDAEKGNNKVLFYASKPFEENGQKRN